MAGRVKTDYMAGGEAVYFYLSGLGNVEKDRTHEKKPRLKKLRSALMIQKAFPRNNLLLFLCVRCAICIGDKTLRFVYYLKSRQLFVFISTINRRVQINLKN